MLAAAFAAGAIASLTENAWLGLLAAIGVSILFGVLHGVACITYRGNQVVAGMAINILVAGLTVVLGRAWFDQGGQTPQLPDDARFAEFPAARPATPFTTSRSSGRSIRTCSATTTSSSTSPSQSCR